MRTCRACGTADQADTASFCFTCGGSLADPTCPSCGGDLPPAGRFCPHCGVPSGAGVEPAAVAQVPAPQGTARKITSVLFGDLVGFTTLSESRDPEEVRELLSAYFDECRAVVSRYGGELEKFIGDAVMAVWGVPITREDDAERAVRAGLELVERVAALGDRTSAMPGLAMRVGHHHRRGRGHPRRDRPGHGRRRRGQHRRPDPGRRGAGPGLGRRDHPPVTSAAIAFVDVGSHAMKGKAEPVPLWAVRAVVAGVGGERSAPTGWRRR